MAIQVTPEEMLEKAGKFQANCDEQLAVIRNSHMLLDELVANGFSGATATAFTLKFEQLEPQLNAAAELLAEISGALENTASNFQQLDLDLASKINS